MLADTRSIQTPTYAWVALSFVPLLVKAVDYLSLGSLVPMAVFVGCAAGVGLAIRRGGRSERRALRMWAIALILWGLVRLAILVLFTVAPTSEAHIEGQLTLWFALVSAAHIGLGGYIVATVRGRAPTMAEA